ncbi:hypothetical protein [Blastococcus sp. SYSU D00820]
MTATAVPVADRAAVQRTTARLRLERGTGAAVGLTGALLTVPGGYAWLRWTVAACLALTVAATAVAVGTPWGRAVGLRRQYARHALVTHTDPGPGRRSDADALARQERNAWLPVVVAALLAANLTRLLGDAAWPLPATGVTGVVLLGLCIAGAAVLRVREVRQARRWLSDPPGDWR